MQIKLDIPKNQQFRPFYLFFLLISIQTGVGLIDTPQIIFREAGSDAWISIILAYLFLCLLVFVMLFILRQYDSTDILGVQADLFGSFISKCIGTVYLLYFTLEILATLVQYIEIISVFIFPDVNEYVIGVMLLFLVIYTILGGLRTVIGVCFLFFILSIWLITLLYEPIRQMDFINLLPVLDSSFSDILKGSVSTAYTFSGVEFLFFIYPFVANKEKINKPVFIGISWFTFQVLILTVISIGFLNPLQLERRIWPVLNLYKVQTTPIIERLDYVVVAEWMMVAAPRMIILMWCVNYIFKRVYQMPKKISLYTVTLIIILCVPFFTDHFRIQALTDLSRDISYGLVYIYPFILLPLVLIKKKLRKGQKK